MLRGISHGHIALYMVQARRENKKAFENSMLLLILPKKFHIVIITRNENYIAWIMEQSLPM